MRTTFLIASLLFFANFSALVVNATTTQPVDSTTTQPAAAPDLSTPIAAVVTYLQAVDSNDAATAKEASIHDAPNEKFIDGVIAEIAAQQKYRNAAVKRFGADRRLSHLGSSLMLIHMVKKGPVHENGDIAEIGDHGDFPCKKVGGNWRLDLVRQNANSKTLDQTITYLAQSAQVYNDFASKAATGNWTSLDELEKARSAAAPKPPEPPDPQ